MSTRRIPTKVMKILVLRHQVPFREGHKRWDRHHWLGNRCRTLQVIGQFSLDVQHKCTVNRAPKVLAHAHAYCQECSRSLPLRAMFFVNGLADCHWHVYGRKRAHVYRYCSHLLSQRTTLMYGRFTKISPSRSRWSSILSLVVTEDNVHVHGRKSAHAYH